MTYSLAWRSESEVFLAADTALTSSPDPRTAHVTESSFGQAHVETDDDRRVEERVLKLFLKKNIGICFAGSYGLALRVIGSFYEKIEQGQSPREALDSSLFSNRFGQGEVLQLAIGYYQDGPKLISFNAQGNLEIVEDETLVQIGNPLERHRNLTQTWVNDVGSDTRDKPEFQLTTMLGILQSYNLFSPQMERGIGGAFGGLFIGKDGGRWQPDILFIEHGGQREKHVGTLFRHDCFVISSPIIGQSRSFSNWIPPQTQSYMYGQAQKAVQKGKKLRSSLEYEFVVILGVENVSLTVIEMKRKLRHALIWITPIKDETGQGTKIAIFPKLREILSKKDSGLTIIGFFEPNIKVVPEDRIVSRTISYN